ncbi:hypothetical protein TNCV_1621511 [Trichonephila clavipes]|nr:hypothetical protein TNCV_1621511 [Trichonephila clavipes]
MMSVDHGNSSELQPLRRSKIVDPLGFSAVAQRCDSRKVTDMGFPSHNYAPLRYAMHVLETLQEVFIWDGVQKRCHVSLDVKSIDKITEVYLDAVIDSNDTEIEGSIRHVAKTQQMILNFVIGDYLQQWFLNLRSPRTPCTYPSDIVDLQDFKHPSLIPNN